MPHSYSPTQLLLSLSTAPLLLVLVGSRVIAELMQDMGQATEEVFRGDRLPVLHVTNAQQRRSEPPE